MSQTFIHRCRRKALQLAIRRFMVRRREDDLVRVGSDYGGWWIPTRALTRGVTVVSAGVGEDTTFDEELLSYGCKVWALDPTPRAQQHVEGRRSEAAALRDGFVFFPVGLWNSDSVLKFFGPADAAHVSYSVVDSGQSHASFEAECWSLPHVLREIGCEAPDVLKLDIEGAEIEVLEALAASAIRPSIVCVELDAPLPELRSLSLLRTMTRAGYRLAHAEKWNLLLLHEPSRVQRP